MTELTTETTAAMRRAGTWRAYLRSEMDRGRQRTTTPPAATATRLRTVLDVLCPHCAAAAGAACTTRSGRHGLTGQHPARGAAYAAELARESA